MKMWPLLWVIKFYKQSLVSPQTTWFCFSLQFFLLGEYCSPPPHLVPDIIPLYYILKSIVQGNGSLLCLSSTWQWLCAYMPGCSWNSDAYCVPCLGGVLLIMVIHNGRKSCNLGGICFWTTITTELAYAVGVHESSRKTLLSVFLNNVDQNRKAEEDSYTRCISPCWMHGLNLYPVFPCLFFSLKHYYIPAIFFFFFDSSLWHTEGQNSWT